MASLTHKMVNGHKYYYARICRRVNGKPKIVRTVYLGSVDRMIQYTAAPKEIPAAKEVLVEELGATAALCQIAQRLQLLAIVDRHAPKRNQGISTGTYMLIATLNRAICPTSKAALAEWFEQTAGPRLLGAKASELSSQAFWNHMDRLDAKTLVSIENDLFKRLVEEFKVDLNCLLYDGTNFYTYINTNTLSELAQRGHNKQKRTDLRQVSLGLLTTCDFHVPLLHMVYGGNIADSTQFGSVIEELVKRYQHLREFCPHVTLVFDKGNNSQQNFNAFPRTQMHFVGSLKLCQCGELLEVPLTEYRQMKAAGLEAVQAYRARLTVFGQERTVLVTYNENLLAGQLQGLGRNISKSRKELHELQCRLRRWANGSTTQGRRPTVESTQKKVDSILHREHMKEIFEVVTEQLQQAVQVRYRLKQDTLSKLTERVLGKTILFTDNDDWSDEQIVLAYRGQYHIEHAFREMKNPHCLGWSPRLHWTDQKIRVHAFYCVAALTLVSLLRRELAAKNLNLSAEQLIRQLRGIRETISVYPQGRGKAPRLSCSLTHLNDTQKQLYCLLGLKQYRQT
ncbi:MAG: IS1634 family transposase [Syntrophaceae bacterium]|nr:IS1634 family transposase [Syntrophaceae bacterium]